MSYQSPQPFYGQPPQPQSSGSVKVIIFVVLGVGCLAALCVVGILAALLIPAISAARDAAARSQSTNNLKQIGIALHNYHDVYNSFPAAHVAGADGKPRTSWRASILPFVDQRALFDQYDSNVPWDDPRNSAVRQTRIATYQSPRDTAIGANRTSYVVVTSQKALQDPPNPNGWTIFPGAKWLKLNDVRDGTSNTIAVVEIRNSDIEWSEPRDIDIDSLSTDPNAPNSIDLQRGAVVVFADAAVQVLPPGTTLDDLKAMLTAGGGEQVMSGY